MSWAAATFTPPLGLACSLIAWLVTAKKEYGSLSVGSTGSKYGYLSHLSPLSSLQQTPLTALYSYPMLAGNVVALLSPIIFIPILSFLPGLRGPKYDWVSMKLIRKGDDSDLAAAAHMDLEQIPGESNQTAENEEMEQKKLQRAAKIARSLTVFLTLALLILWPMPMYGSGYVFSKRFFTGWVSVGILWLFCSSFCVAVYPVWEGRHTSARTIKAIFFDITGKGRPVVHGRATVAETVEVEEKMVKKGSETPPEKAVETE